MDLIVDAIVFQSSEPSGSLRIYSEILPRICELETSLGVTMLTTGPCRQPLPVHPRIRHLPLLPVSLVMRPQRLWGDLVPWTRAWLQHRALADRKRGIWQSTYYTSPRSWDGPIVTILLDMIYELFPHMFNAPYDEQVRRRKRHNILMADKVICISETSKKDALQIYGIDESRTAVIHLACTPEFKVLGTESGAARGGQLPHKPFFLYVGKRGLYKNCDLLLKAYSRWKGASEVDLVVVGSPWAKQEQQRLSDLGLQTRVKLLPFVDDANLCHLYNHASAFVYPSLYEGFGIPSAESMSCGCPVIASKIPSTVEIAGECPIYFEPSDEEGFIAALESAISEGRDSPRSRSGLEHVKRYSWESTASRVLEIYRALAP